MTNKNHVGDRDELVVGDNDHGDAIPKCGSCGVAWVDHIGIMGVCAANAQLTKERDEARRESCVWGSRTEMGARSLAKFKGWDCYKKEETQQAMNNIAKLDEELGL